MTCEPIMGGHADCYTQPWDPGHIAACFPCGAIRRGDNFLVSYGWLDAETRIAEIPIAEIDARLEPFEKRRHEVPQ